MYGLAARAVRISPRRADLPLPDAPGGALPRRQPLTAHDVAFSLNILKEKGHPIIQQLLRDFAGAEAADDATVVVRFARSARATCRCSSPALPIFSRAYYQQAPVRRIDARHSARLGPLQGRTLRGRPLHRVRARQGLVGRRNCRSSRGQNNFDIAALRILSRPRRRLRRLHRPRTICSARNSPRASGRRATISRPSATAASSARCCPTIRRPARRAGSSTRGASKFNDRRCARR